MDFREYASGLNSEFSFSETSYFIKVKKSQSTLQAGGWKERLMTFRGVLEQSERKTDLSRI